jgi:hypothetical protein
VAQVEAECGLGSGHDTGDGVQPQSSLDSTAAEAGTGTIAAGAACFVAREATVSGAGGAAAKVPVHSDGLPAGKCVFFLYIALVKSRKRASILALRLGIKGITCCCGWKQRLEPAGAHKTTSLAMTTYFVCENWTCIPLWGQSSMD